jgi:hypothetical protein
MRQLVGCLCVFCRQRISDIVEGEFCAACENPIHRRCTNSRTKYPRMRLCSTCGCDLEGAAASPFQGDRRLSSTVTRDQGTLNRIARPIRIYRGIRFLAGGIFCLVLGSVLAFHPGLRSDPKHLTLQDMVPGLGALLAGVVMCLLGIVFVRQK